MSATLQEDAAPPAAAANGRRPGLSGLRPLLYQLISYSVIAAVNALLSMTLINAIVFYGGIDSGWRLVGAAAATAFVALVNSYFLGSALTFRSSALFRGQLFARSLIVNLAGVAMQVGIFAAVALTLLARTDAGPNAASTIAEAGALAATSFAVFFGLRQWAYRPEPAHVQERPVLAAGGWVPVSNLDPELTTIAAGERHLRALWRARYAVTVYGIALVTLLAYGWYSTSYLGMNNGDGTARVTQAFAAVFSRDPHLGALSLIWPPIPAFVDIPLVVLLRPFGQAFLAGSVMGALFMADAVALLFYVLREVGAGRALAALLTVAFLTHQHVYQSAAAGLSEAPRDVPAGLDARLPALAEERVVRDAGRRRPDGRRGDDVALRGDVLGDRDGVRHRDHAAWQHPVLALFSRASRSSPRDGRRDQRLAVGVRRTLRLRDGAVDVDQHPDQGQPHLLPRRSRVHAHGAGHRACLRRGAPAVRRLPLVWRIAEPRRGPDHAALAADRACDRRPRAVRAAQSQRGSDCDRRRRLVDHPLPGRDRVHGRAPALGAVLVLWVVPMGLVLAAYGVSRIPLPGLRTLVTAAVVVLAFVPNLRVFINAYDGFTDEQPTRAQRIRNGLLTTPDLGSVLARQQAEQEYRRVADTVEELIPPGALVLLDVVGPGGPIPMFARNPERFVTTTDRDFEERFLYTPWETVGYVLVPFPTFDRLSRSVLLRAHDDIWDEALAWTELELEIEGPTRWKLLRVLPGGPVAANR